MTTSGEIQWKKIIDSLYLVIVVVFMFYPVDMTYRATINPLCPDDLPDYEDMTTVQQHECSGNRTTTLPMITAIIDIAVDDCIVKVEYWNFKLDRTVSECKINEIEGTNS